MVTKPLTKLIDEAIVPAVILVVAKMLGVLLASLALKTPFEVTFKGFLNILPQVSFTNANDYIRAENFSNVIMFIIVVLGNAFVIVKAHFLHASHISPRMHTKIAKLNMDSFISSSYHLYHQAAIWLIFLWLTNAFLIMSSLSHITYPQISVIALIVSINLTWVYASDIEREIELVEKV